MLREKIVWLFVMTFVIFLSSCAPGAQTALPPGLTPAPGTDIPEDLATVMQIIFTQTSEPITALPDPNADFGSSSTGGLKPPVSEAPAAGICQEVQAGLYGRCKSAFDLARSFRE